MKKILAAFFAILLVSLSFAYAGIESYVCDDDGDGVIVVDDISMSLTYDSGPDEYTLSMDCAQTSLSNGHIEGDFNAPADPKVWIAETVENNTTFAWTDYHITIGMTKPFSISTSVITPDDWSFAVSQPVAGQLPNGNGPGYIGTIDYYAAPAGSPIAIGDSGDFGFKVVFDGSVEFCTEQHPTIPEPATMALLGLGVLALRRKK